MQTILEALARWRPPDGKVRSVTVEVDPATMAHTAMIAIERSRGVATPVLLTINHYDAMNLTMEAIAHKLTVAALATYAESAAAQLASASPKAIAPKPEKPAGRPAA